MAMDGGRSDQKDERLFERLLLEGLETPAEEVSPECTSSSCAATSGSSSPKSAPPSNVGNLTNSGG